MIGSWRDDLHQTTRPIFNENKSVAKQELEPFGWPTGLGAQYPNPTFVATLHVRLKHPTFFHSGLSKSRS